MAIYKNTSGTAELFANIGGGSGGGDKAHYAYNLQSYLTISSDLSSSASILAANAIYMNGITKLNIVLQVTANITLTSTTSIAKLTASAPAYMRPIAESYARLSSTQMILDSELWVSPASYPAYFDWHVFCHYTGAQGPWDEFKIDKSTASSGSLTVNSGEYLQIYVTFFNNYGGANASVSEETYTSIASNLSIVGNLPLSVYYGRMHRYGRDTYLEICLKTTDEWTFTSSSFGVVQITDSDGKLMPFWLDSQHQCVYQCGCASFNGAPLFLARMFYYDATHSTVVFEPSEGKTISAINSEIYLSLHFTNKYDE